MNNFPGLKFTNSINISMCNDVIQVNIYLYNTRDLKGGGQEQLIYTSHQHSTTPYRKLETPLCSNTTTKQ